MFSTEPLIDFYNESTLESKLGDDPRCRHAGRGSPRSHENRACDILDRHLKIRLEPDTNPLIHEILYTTVKAYGKFRERVIVILLGIQNGRSKIHTSVRCRAEGAYRLQTRSAELDVIYTDGDIILGKEN